MLHTDHTLFLRRGRWFCRVCSTYMPAPAGAVAWLSAPCPVSPAQTAAVLRPGIVRCSGPVVLAGRVLHASHLLSCYRGMWYCMSCGRYAAFRPQQLLSRCLKDKGPGGRAVLARLDRGLPPKGGIWPDSRLATFCFSDFGF